MDKSKHTTPKQKTFWGKLGGAIMKTLFTFVLGGVGGAWLCNFNIRDDLPTWSQLMDRASTVIDTASEARASTTTVGLFTNSVSSLDMMRTPSGRLTNLSSRIVEGSNIIACKDALGQKVEGSEAVAYCMSPIVWRQPLTTPNPFAGWCDVAVTGPCVKAARVYLAEDGSVLYEKVYLYLDYERRPYFEGPEGVKLDRRAQGKKIFFQMYEEQMEGR